MNISVHSIREHQPETFILLCLSIWAGVLVRNISVRKKYLETLVDCANIRDLVETCERTINSAFNAFVLYRLWICGNLNSVT